MGFGNDKNSLKMYSVSFKNTKKSDGKGYLSLYDLSEKAEVDQGPDVSGELYAIKFTDREYEGKKTRQCTIYLKDGKVGYMVKTGMTLAGRAILNRLLTATDFSNIKISYFGPEGEYKNAAVKSNDVKLEYMFNKDECAPYIDKITNKTGEVVQTDYTALDKFLEDKINEVVVPKLKRTDDVITDDDVKHVEEQNKDIETKVTPSEDTTSLPQAMNEPPF